MMYALDQITINSLFVTLIVSTLIPLLVGVVTKLGASSSIKVVTMLVLNAVSALFTVGTQQDGTAVISKTAAIYALFGVVQSVALYYGVWKPSGVSAAINTKTSNVGIG